MYLEVVDNSGEELRCGGSVLSPRHNILFGSKGSSLHYHERPPATFCFFIQPIGRVLYCFFEIDSLLKLRLLAFLFSSPNCRQFHLGYFQIQYLMIVIFTSQTHNHCSPLLGGQMWKARQKSLGSPRCPRHL